MLSNRAVNEWVNSEAYSITWHQPQVSYIGFGPFLDCSSASLTCQQTSMKRNIWNSLKLQARPYKKKYFLGP